MSNCIRKLRRNKLKQEIGSNKIKEIFHTANDPLWKRLKTGIKNAQEENLTGKK